MSIKRIAELADVSVSTVSNYLNHRQKVAPATAEAIEAAMQNHDWQPNIRRRGPKSKGREGVRTGNILLFSITSHSLQAIMKMHVMAELLAGIQHELNSRQFSLTLLNVGRDFEIPVNNLSKNYDGVILVGDLEESAESLRKLDMILGDIPAVWCGRRPSATSREIDSVYYDGAEIGKMAAEYLFYRGHRHVGLFNGNSRHMAYVERAKTFILRAEELGMTAKLFSSQLDEGTLPDAASYQRLTEEYLQHKQLSGAFFCSDDVMLGFYQSMLRKCSDEPALDMIGCNNDEELLRYFSCRPATIDINFPQVGARTVTHILSLINKQNYESGTALLIKPKLIPGNKTTFSQNQ